MLSILLNECHVFTDDVPVDDLQQKAIGYEVDLLQSMGFSQEWIESFYNDLHEAKDNPEKDKLEADLNQVHIFLQKLATWPSEIMVAMDDQLVSADEVLEERLEEMEKEDLELLKMELEELNDHDDDSDDDKDDSDDDHNVR